MFILLIYYLRIKMYLYYIMDYTKYYKNRIYQTENGQYEVYTRYYHPGYVSDPTKYLIYVGTYDTFEKALYHFNHVIEIYANQEKEKMRIFLLNNGY